MHKETVLKQVAQPASPMLVHSLSHIASRLRNYIHSIRFLASQGIPLRGLHEVLDSLDSNLYKLLLHRAEDCPEVKTWIYR